MIDWIFRPQCVGCGMPAATLCSACSASLVELGPACPRCAEPTGGPAATEGEGEGHGEGDGEGDGSLAG